MSLADLPIENIALIQSYITNAVVRFDTRLLRVCRAIREKALAHTWPPLYIAKVDVHAAAMMNIYKFDTIYILNNELEHQMLTLLRPDLNVDVLMKYPSGHLFAGNMVARHMVNGRLAMAYRPSADMKIAVTEPMSLTVIGGAARCKNTIIEATVEYDLTVIIEEGTVVNITLSGVYPKRVRWTNGNGSPYVCNDKLWTHRSAHVTVCNGADVIALLYVRNHWYKLAPGVSYVQTMSDSYRNMLSPYLSYAVINTIATARYKNIYHAIDIDRVCKWLDGHGMHNIISAAVDVDDIVATVRAVVIQNINARK